LRQNGIKLPVELLLDTGNAVSPLRAGKTLRKILKKMGIDAVRSEKRGEQNRFRLSITVDSGEAFCELYDGGRGTNVFREIIPLPSLGLKDIGDFAAALGDAIFTGFGQ
jgi:hypothetical protein